MINWLIETLISSTLLIITILILRKLVGRYIGSRWVYGMWLIPLLLLVLPELQIFLPELLTPITYLSDVSVLVAQNSLDTLQTSDLSVLNNTSTLGKTSFIYQYIFITVWLVGVAIYWLMLWYKHKNFIRNSTSIKSNKTIPIYDTITQLCSMLRLKNTPQLSFSASTQTPFVYGVLKPQLILPTNILNSLTSSQIEMLLTHELIHLKRGDLLFNILGQLFVGLFWFSPIVHFGFKAFKIDQEKSCDELVINKLSLTQSVHSYGQLLFDSALLNNKPSPLLSLWGGSSKTQTRERIEMLKYYSDKKIKHGLGLMVVTLISFIFLTNVSAHQIQTTSKDLNNIFADISNYIDNNNFEKALISLKAITENELTSTNKQQQAKYFALKTITHIQLNQACNAKKSILGMRNISANMPLTKQAEINFGFYRSESTFSAKELDCMFTAIMDLNNKSENHKLSLDLSINFDIQSINVLESDTKKIVELGKLLTTPKYDKYSINLIGHTDSYGAKDLNLSLSKTRAYSVLSELERLYPSIHGRLTAIGQGELNPISSNDTERGRKINRRVEVVLDK